VEAGTSPAMTKERLGFMLLGESLKSQFRGADHLCSARLMREVIARIAEITPYWEAIRSRRLLLRLGFAVFGCATGSAPRSIDDGVRP